MNETDRTTNQGEGDKRSARRFNEAEQRFVQSGRVDAAAREAQPADAREAADLEKAEEVGRSHAKDDDSRSSASDQKRHK